MRFLILAFTALMTACLSSGVRTAGAAPPPGPAHVNAVEPGVVPPGTSVVVRTNDPVNTARALRGTIYDADIAEDILNQDGTVLIPKESPVELVVRSLSYLGPGGVEMTELTLDIGVLTVNGVRYPVGTESKEPDAGGLGVDRRTPRWVGGEEPADHVLTRGRRIYVPARTLLAFRLEDPIRLRGYRR